MVMDLRQLPQCGEAVFLSEISSSHTNKGLFDGKSIRVTGNSGWLPLRPHAGRFASNLQMFAGFSRDLPGFLPPQYCKMLPPLEHHAEDTTHDKLTHYDYNSQRAVLHDPRSGADITVATRLVEPFDACVGELVQFIGELEFPESAESNVILHARVMRCVGDLDLTMYQKALEQQRAFFQKRPKTNDT